MMSEELLNDLLSEKEFCALKMFDFLNREIINKNYTIQEKNFSDLLKYLRNRKIEYLDTIWSKSSIQRNVFLTIVNLCDFCFKIKNITFPYIEKFFQDKEKLFFTIPIIKNYSKELYKIYLISRNKHKIKFYKSENFECYSVDKYNDVSNLYLDSNDIFLHIILDGVICVNGKSFLTKGDLYYSGEFPLKENFVPLSPEFKKIIIVIKKSFFVKSKIIIKNENKNKVFLPIINELENIFNSPLDDSVLLETITYLIEYFNNKNIINFEPQYIEKKKIIVDIIQNNILLPRKVIVDKLLNELDVSLSKLYSIFYILFGIPINKYIDKIKLDKACTLLITTVDPISYISSQLGFNEEVLLAKFSKYIGCTPLKFRKDFCDK
ncbi:helix-turn-helix domain-containing protein [Fusobacterium perfoetens]|uniref:helix-turn-helix domain-containing protein n=1 Tax=Fusobacterium perfoetens TaxID=852 RepID=UPI0004882FA3|nr:AraC family transcriptional regulator [Fusobacterium perfoetens]